MKHLRCVALLLFISSVAIAHSGRTDATGCHAGSQPRHCHGVKGSASSKPAASGGYSRSKPAASGGNSRDSYGGYDRDSYGGWWDDDRDCKNTRHETLESQNIGQIRYSANGCRVVAGRWNGVYSGKTFYDAKQLDADHIFPVALADVLGARRWSKDKKRAFYNDPANVIAVSASLNRQKGAKGPTQWLPPNRAYRCEYVTRFLRIGLKYKLISSNYKNEIDRVRSRVCS